MGPKAVRGRHHTRPRNRCQSPLRPCCLNSRVRNHRNSPLDDISLEHLFGAVMLLMAFCVSYYVLQRRSKAQAAATVISAAQIEEEFPEIPINDEPTCVICLAEIETCGRKLQCGHCFHSQCISDWWTVVPRTVIACPTCKRKQRLSESGEEASCDVALRTREELSGEVRNQQYMEMQV